MAQESPESPYRHGTSDRLWIGTWREVRYVHHTPFWRAVLRDGYRLGGDEGGSSYRVGDDLYVIAHDGTRYYHFVVPYHFAA